MQPCDAGTYRIVQGVGWSEKGGNWGWEVGTHMPGTRCGGLVGITLGWSRDEGEKERRGGVGELGGVGGVGKTPR
jgi:hypothetical protein